LTNRNTGVADSAFDHINTKGIDGMFFFASMRSYFVISSRFVVMLKICLASSQRARRTMLFALSCVGLAPVFAAAANLNFSQSLANGWNLLGASTTTPIEVGTTFADPTKYVSVWKWDAKSAKWAFFSPSMDATALASYAASKGYSVLSQVAGGEGFWVNARSQPAAMVQSGAGVALAKSALATGWNLVATGDAVTAPAFNRLLSAATVGTPENLTSLWAWDSASSHWYFYAPSLDGNGTLASYISGKGYLDFANLTLDNGRGFWVNLPAAAPGGSGNLMGGAIQGTPLPSSLGVVTTLAGAGISGFANGTGTAAKFGRPSGITTDGTNLYVADNTLQQIRKIVIATGEVTTFAGDLNTQGGSMDGIGTSARFSGPAGVTATSTDLFVVDNGNNTVRQINLASAAVTTLAGTPAQRGGLADGVGAAAKFKNPQGITTDGTYLYVADKGNNLIRKIVISTGAVSTFATVGAPIGVTTDGTHLYVTTDAIGMNVTKIPLSGTATPVLFAGSGMTAFGCKALADGAATSATFCSPGAITSDGTSLYVADTSNHVIRRIDMTTGVVSSVAGSAGTPGITNGTGTAARFVYPAGIVTDGRALYVAEQGNSPLGNGTVGFNIRKIQ